MSVKLALGDNVARAVRRVVPQFVADLGASRMTSSDATLWGPDAEAEAATRLGWVEAVSVSRPLVDDVVALRDALREQGVERIVLCGMGGSSLAPEVITRTYGVELTVLDSTDPGQVRAALGERRLTTTAVVISSKSGSTLETDSHKRIFEERFRAAGIDPLDRIVVVTDAGSPLDESARAAGYRVFNADPNVGGRYSALTAFGLVPSGLAGVDLDELLDEAETMSLELAIDSADNAGLVLGAAMAQKGKLGIVPDGTHILGFGEWAEQLIAESTGKRHKGVLPVVLDAGSPEVAATPPDLQIIRLVADWEDTRDVAADEIEITGTLGSQLLTWEYATAVAARLLGVNPFDQPDVESAKVATRAIIDNPTPRPDPAFVAGGIEVRGTQDVVGGASDLASAVEALLGAIGADGYLSIHAYVNRVAHPRLPALRDEFAARIRRPVTFGWGPRFLHSTGQFHKGGPAIGVFLQIIAAEGSDLQIPDRPFTFGELIRAQADGDASVLAAIGRPVLSLTLEDPDAVIPALLDALR